MGDMTSTNLQNRRKGQRRDRGRDRNNKMHFLFNIVTVVFLLSTAAVATLLILTAWKGALRGPALSALVLMGLSGGTGLVLMTRLFSQVRKVSDGIGGVYDGEGRGDLTLRLDINGNAGTTEVARSFNIFTAMIDNLVYKLKSAARDSGKNNRLLLDRAKELEEGSDRITEELKEILSRMDDLAAVVDEARQRTEQVSEASEGISDQVQRQSSAVTESSASVTEMNASIRTITENSNRRLSLVDSLRDQVRTGKEQVDKNGEVVRTIAEKTDDIQSFIGTINSIASQTSLLAMNAAIEAAHAGEAGRGFSVVAEEVRKLSNDTTKNARNIKENLLAVVAGINEAREISAEVAGAFAEILEGIEDFAAGVAEVTEGLQEISTGTKEVDTALSELVSITGEVNDSSASITESSRTIFDSIRRVTDVTGENREFISHIEQGMKVSNNAARQFSEICEASVRDIDSLLEQVGRYTITDFGALTSVDGQSLILWNDHRKSIPIRPDRPETFPELDKRHWYDEEFAAFTVPKEEKARPIPSPCDGPEGKRIAVYVPSDYPYYAAYERGLHKVADLLSMKTEVIKGGGWGGKGQQNFFDTAMKGGYDLIVVAPADREALEVQVKAAYERGIPVIVSQAAPTKETFRYILSYTGFDDWGTQRIFARHFADRLDRQGGYAVAGHQSGGAMHHARSYGFATEIADYAPDMKLLDLQPTDVDEERTYELVTGWLEKYGDELKGLFVADSLDALKGAVGAIERAGRDDIMVYTTGNNAYSLDMVKAGKCHGIRWESGEADGALPIETAASWFSGLVIDPVRFLPMHTITRQDVEEYYPAQW